MIALDTNVLVYAHRPENPFHEKANGIVRSLAEGNDPWVIPWPVVHEFLAIVTHPKIFKEPTSTANALLQASIWLAAPTVLMAAEIEGYFPVLQSLLQKSAVTGPKVHDARIVAICISNGVSALFSADRDFSRFGTALTIENPFLKS